MGRSINIKLRKLLFSSHLLILFSLLIIRPVSALTFENPIGLEFSFGSFLNVTLSGDLLIDNLAPGNSSDSNIITVITSTNNVAGYDVKATVGSSSYNYTDLRLSSNDTTNIFSSLNSNAATLNAFNDSTWGYSYCNNTNDCTSSTYWVSGNAGSTNTGYNGLPIYSNTGILLVNINTSTDSTIKFKIGAKASDAQAAGDYTNIVNFIATSKILTTNYTLNYLANDGNNGSDTSGMPNPATISDAIAQNTNYTLSSATPTRDGYTFSGWCDGTVTTTSGVDSCSGTTYQPQTTYTIPNSGGSITINLNAMWEEIGITDLTNTTWYLLNPVVNEPMSQQIYHINYTSNDTQYTFLTEDGLQIQYGNGYCENYYDFSCYTSGYQYRKGWGTWASGSFVSNNIYNTIHITGGTDTTNTDLIDWLQTHALQANLVEFSFSHSHVSNFGLIEIYEGTEDSPNSLLHSLTNLQSTYEISIPLTIENVYVKFIDKYDSTLSILSYFSSTGEITINTPPQGLGSNFLEFSILGDGSISGSVNWDH